MIIDTHTHTFPDNIAAGALAGMEKKIETGRGWQVKVKLAGTREALMESTKKNGVDISIVVPVATKPQQTESINRFAVQTNETTKETGVFSLGAIHPDNENYKEILNQVKEMGLKGIKLHPDYQRTCFNDLKYLRIMEYASQLGLVIVTHAGDDIGIPEKTHCTPDMIVEVLETIHPEKLVLAHMGGWNLWDEVEEKLIGRDVYLDTAFCFEPDIPHIEEEKFVKMVRKHGADKILFATDSPWSDQGYTINKIKSFDLTPNEKKLILGENAAQLFGALF